MKKLLFTLSVLLLALSATVSAKASGTAGHIYSTDIRAFINGTELPSYNIGGKTVVIIEDITTDFYYYDSLRTLIVSDFAPENLIERTHWGAIGTIGKIIGNIYPTDIKTYIRGTSVPCYSLGGKMAVALEDIGGVGEFNELGARCFWNATERTISMDYLLDNRSNIRPLLNSSHTSLYIDGNGFASFKSEPIMYGEVYSECNPSAGIAAPVTFSSTTIGYAYRAEKRVEVYQDDNGNYYLNEDKGYGFIAFDTEKISDIVKDIEPIQPTREDWLEYYDSQMMTVIDSFETEAYTFLYMYQPTPHGTTQMLRRVSADGNVTEYGTDFEPQSIWGIKTFSDLSIDREKEKVSFKYNDIGYEIDLKSGEMAAAVK